MAVTLQLHGTRHQNLQSLCAAALRSNMPAPVLAPNAGFPGVVHVSDQIPPVGRIHYEACQAQGGGLLLLLLFRELC
jgi:hypothetical protein